MSCNVHAGRAWQWCCGHAATEMPIPASSPAPTSVPVTLLLLQSLAEESSFHHRVLMLCCRLQLFVAG